MDEITKANKQVDQTQAVVFENVKELLDRNQDVNNLVEKSKDLSMHTKAFMKNANKANKSDCCSIF